jgi:hypothetical protein
LKRCWQPKPVRPSFRDLASHRQGKLVSLVWQTGQANFVLEIAKKIFKAKPAPKHLNNLSTFEQEKP